MNLSERFNERFEMEKARIAAELEHGRIVAEEKTAKPGELVIPAMFGVEAPLMKSEEYLRNARGWVASCVDAIAESIAAVEFRLNEIKNGEVSEVLDHPALDLIYNPNPVQTKFDFWHLVSQYLELVGEAPIFAVRNGPNVRPTALLLLPPNNFSPGGSVKDEMSFVPYDHFKYRVGGAKEIRLELWETLFLRIPDPAKPYRGIGTLAKVARTVDIDEFSEKWNANFFYNSARPDAVLTTDQVLTKKQKEDLKLMLKQAYGGVKNAHKQMVLDHGFKYEPMALTQKDMDFIEQQRYSRDKIFSVFRVPKSLVAVSEDVNFASAKTHMAAFLEFTIKPKLMRIEEQLNEFFLPMFPDAEKRGLFFTHAPLVQDDEEAKLKRYANGRTYGWMTPNEVRFEENLESLGPEGDDPSPSGPVGNLGLGEGEPTKRIIPASGKGMTREQMAARRKKAAKPNRAVLVRQKRSAKEKEENEKATDEAVENLTEKMTTLIKSRLAAKKQQRKDEEEPPVKKEHEEFWKGFVTKAEGLEKPFIASLRKAFKDQKERVLGRLWKGVAENVRKGISDWLLDEEDDTRIMVGLMLPQMNEIFVAQGREAMKLVGKDPSLFNIQLERVQNFIKRRTFKFSVDVSKTTNDKLRSALSEGVAAGEGISDLAARVEQVFKKRDEVDSEKIARSEVLLASNSATEEAYKQSGVVESKEWLIALDNRTCPICKAIVRKRRVVPVGENFFDRGDSIVGTDGKHFTFDYRSIDVPPAHANCRCTVVPILK